MTAFLLFVLSAILMPLRYLVGKENLLPAFLCVMLCCAGTAVAVLSMAPNYLTGACIALVLLSVLLIPEGSRNR